MEKIELERLLLGAFAPDDSQDDPAYPNHTNTDIWLVGCMDGLEIAAKAILGEYGEQTQKWLYEKIKRGLEKNG